MSVVLCPRLFCMVDILKYKKTRDKKIGYPNIFLSFTPGIHCPHMSIPRPSQTTGAVSSTSSEGDNLEYEVKIFSSKAAYFSDQKDLDDLSQNLSFKKSKHRCFFYGSKNRICSIHYARFPIQKLAHYFANFYAKSTDSISLLQCCIRFVSRNWKSLHSFRYDWRLYSVIVSS